MENPVIFIDDKMVPYDHFYDDDDCLRCGAIYGLDEQTKGHDKVRNFQPTRSVFGLGIWRVNDDGSIWGIKALFNRHEWGEDEQGCIQLKVWERVV